MNIIRDLKKIFKLEIFTFIYRNYFDKKIINKNGRIFPYKKSSFVIDIDGKVNLFGDLITNYNYINDRRKTTLIRLKRNAVLNVKEKFTLYYDSDILLFENAVLTLGSGYCNVNAKIRCKKEITIGSNVIIAHDVLIMDSDFHEINNNEMTMPIIIGDNVWIGARVTILKGVTIGTGAVIAAGSIVTKSIPSNCLAAGIPARVIKKDVRWK